MTQRQGGERVIKLELPNGEEIEAPVGIWFLAFTEIMDTKQREALFNKVKAYRDRAMQNPILYNPGNQPMGNLVQRQVVHTDFTVDKKGRKHYSMHCEGGTYAEKGTGLRTSGVKETG